MTAPTHETERSLLARVAGLLYDRRLTELQGGNMSFRDADVAIVSPTKASENTGWRLAAEDMLVQTLDGEVLVGDRSLISREISLHLRLYRSFPEVGAVFHLHLPEALAMVDSGQWRTGVVSESVEPFGASVVVLEADLRAQTEPHDARVVELLERVHRADGALSISPGHGIFIVAGDLAAAIRSADVFRQRLEFERLRHRLRRDGGGPPA